MKIKKIGAIAAAALVMTSLAVSASAASNLYANSNAAQKSATYVVDAGVDVSNIDWANIQVCEPAAIGAIDPAAINGGTITVGKDAISKTAVYAAEVDVDLSAIDWADIQVSEPAAIGAIDPAAVNGGFTTEAKPVK